MRAIAQGAQAHLSHPGDAPVHGQRRPFGSPGKFGHHFRPVPPRHEPGSRRRVPPHDQDLRRIRPPGRGPRPSGDRHPRRRDDDHGHPRLGRIGLPAPPFHRGFRRAHDRVPRRRPAISPRNAPEAGGSGQGGRRRRRGQGIRRFSRRHPPFHQERASCPAFPPRRSSGRPRRRKRRPGTNRFTTATAPKPS